mgnify:CR=1 FL=1
MLQNKSIIPILAVVAILALVGSALAMWYDILKIAVTVNTGEVDVEFGTITATEEPEAEGKEVASCTATLVEVENEGPDDNDLDLDIIITNAYPSYRCTVEFEVVNTGTIPVYGPYKLQEGLEPVPENLELFPASEQLDLDGDGDYDVEVTYNMAPVQIDPDGSATFSIEFHILQDADELDTYSMQILMYFIQWNEAPAG